MQKFLWPEMTMGVCYYPEHWPRALWESDLDRMLEAGITRIRIAELLGASLSRRRACLPLTFLMNFWSSAGGRA